VLVVEGVMGLFDGAALDGPEASTASIAKLLDAPVVLVVDASAMSGSVAALVHGFVTFDPSVQIAGVVLNQVGSASHEDMLRRALAPMGVPVIGALHRDAAFAWRDRHLGLVPVVEHAGDVGRSLDRLAVAVAAGIDLDALLSAASAAPARPVHDPPMPSQVGRARIAVASGPAFDFVYRDNLEALEAAGAELLPFDPLHDRRLPDGTQALYAGGGFPEVFAPALAENEALLQDVRRHDVVIWAECGGLLWLARSLDDHPMGALIDGKAHMTDRLTLGYRRAVASVDTPLAAAGTELRGHEFHYSVIAPAGDGLLLHGRGGSAPGGFVGPRLFASYLHLHLGGDPTPAERLVRAVG